MDASGSRGGCCGADMDNEWVLIVVGLILMYGLGRISHELHEINLTLKVWYVNRRG
jgi:hypothetical protein